MSRSRALQFYILARLLLAPLMLLMIATLIFALMRATPGDPADAVLGSRAPEAQKAALRERLGLADPLWLQYLRYLGQLLRLDLGESLTQSGVSVWQIVGQHFPATVELAAFGMLVAVATGIAVGTLAASRPGTPLEAFGRLFGTVTYALPLFWVGMLLQLVFAVNLGWFPLGTRFPVEATPPPALTGLYTLDGVLSAQPGKSLTALYYLALPSLTLGLLLSGIFERIIRANLKQTLLADYVEAARARGIPERRVLLAHALKNALVPVVTVLGLTFAALLSGTVLTEVTFSWPGLGNRLYEAISVRDYTTVQGVMVFFGGVVVLVSLAIDIASAAIDPRIRY
ncbi:MAG: ABC transporter permease [Cyanobacteria bacterium QS_8_64_29]|nr:MAG: ABC transporter permease [Cyanobacteria bacterium QS_8_64_29]